jgi:hypothetical protein
MDGYCPQCREQLLEEILDHGIALACPLCSKVYHFAEFVALSPAFPQEVREEAADVSNAAWGIGLIVLGAVVVGAIFDQPNQRR